MDTDMEIGLILKIAGIGLIVSVLTQVLSKNGREDHASLVSLAGVITVLFLLITRLGDLISTIQGVFGLV